MDLTVQVSEFTHTVQHTKVRQIWIGIEYIFQSSFLGEGSVLHGNANAKVVIHGIGDMS
jgi:hypothetical protein